MKVQISGRHCSWVRVKIWHQRGLKKIRTKKVNVSTNVGIQLHRVSLETLKINRNRDGCMSDWFVQILINGYSCACKFGIFSEFHKFCKSCDCMSRVEQIIFYIKIRIFGHEMAQQSLHPHQNSKYNTCLAKLLQIFQQIWQVLRRQTLHSKFKMLNENCNNLITKS